MDPNQYPYLESRKQAKKEKDLDNLQEELISMLSVYSLKTDEVATLLFSTMRTVMLQKANKRKLKENFSIDVEKLNVEGILTVQRALTESYLKNNLKVG